MSLRHKMAASKDLVTRKRGGGHAVRSRVRELPPGVRPRHDVTGDYPQRPPLHRPPPPRPFDHPAQRGYPRDLTFSALVDLMSLVACGTSPHVKAAHQHLGSQI